MKSRETGGSELAGVGEDPPGCGTRSYVGCRGNRHGRSFGRPLLKWATKTFAMSVEPWCVAPLRHFGLQVCSDEEKVGRAWAGPWLCFAAAQTLSSMPRVKKVTMQGWGRMDSGYSSLPRRWPSRAHTGIARGSVSQPNPSDHLSRATGQKEDNTRKGSLRSGR